MHLHSMRKHLMRLHKIHAHGILGVVTEVTELVVEWRELARQVAQTTYRLDKALQNQHGLGMSEFELLDRLAEGGSPNMRMQELGEAVHLTQSALSRAVARLEKDGLVTRGMCESDRRGVSVCLTDTGRSRWQEALPTHRSVLEESFTATHH
jgi:DNA-binding MarR family transcriptional regulator